MVREGGREDDGEGGRRMKQERKVKEAKASERLENLTHVLLTSFMDDPFLS